MRDVRILLSVTHTTF